MAQPKISWTLSLLEDVASTQDALKDGLDAGRFQAGQVLRTLRQSAGRGRHGRVWEDGGAGNLMFSLAVRPDLPQAQWGSFSLLAGMALMRALSGGRGEAGGLNALKGAALKWPNDVLLNGQKIAGILCEVHGDYLILGMGVNIASAPFEGAACLGDAYQAAPLLDEILKALACLYEDWDQSGWHDTLAREWCKAAHPVGAPLSVKLGDTRLDGTFAGLGEGGSLLLRQGDERIRTITSGDVLMRES